MNNRSFTYHLMINPSAASGKHADQVKKVLRVFERCGHEVRIHSPETEAAAEALVRELTSQGEAVHLVSLGGDGTLNTVLNGIEDLEHTRLSCIPVGSGNDFARNMHLDRDAARAAVHLVTAPQEMMLDFGEMICRDESGKILPPRRFIISSGIGYDADICEEVARHPAKRMLNRLGLGKLVYLLIGIKQMFTRKSSGCTVQLDDRKPIHIGQLFFAVGMLQRCEGGGVPFCPDADPTDGMLDVCIAKAMPPFQAMASLVLVYLGQHRLIRKLRLMKCRRMKVVTDTPQWFHIDGDTSVRINMIDMCIKSGLHFVR